MHLDFRLALAALPAALLVAAAVACSSSSSGATGAKDAGPEDSCAPIDSQCGQPCEEGNSLGVGHYCAGIDQLETCQKTPQAHLCSSLGSSSTHFCTFQCMAADAAVPEGGVPLPTDCGEGATCTCNGGGQCGCTPNSCLGM